ncbi:MAG: hypothetical protein V4549_14835 [Bacteroidota bacterium]
MKKKYITITLSAFLFFAGFTNIQAQDTPFLQFGGKPGQDTVVTKKTTMWSKLTQTPWIVQFGPDIVVDNDTRLKEFKVFESRNYYPIHASAEKRILKGLSIQVVLSSTSLQPHDFWSTDINAKYSLLTKNIEDTKWFDPYALLGGGHTYRDFPHGQHKGTNHDNSGNLNVGGGVNIWAFNNAGIYLQSVAKFNLLEKKYDGSNYLQFSAGVVFKIGGAKVAKVVEEVKVVPSTYKRSKEAEDAAKYLRDILNK